MRGVLNKIGEWYWGVGPGSGVHLGLTNEVCGMLRYADRRRVERKSQAWLEGGI